MKWGSVVPVKTKKSLSQEPLIVIIHKIIVNLSIYECIVYFTLFFYDFLSLNS